MPSLEEAYFGWGDGENEMPPKGSFDIKTVEKTGQRQFLFVCPGCATLGILAIRPVFDGSPQSWDLTGGADAPTLSPSVNHVGCWHGWLRQGVWSEA